MKKFLLSTVFVIAGATAQAATVNFSAGALVSVGTNPDVIDETPGASGILPLTGNESRSFVAEDMDEFGPGQGRATSSFSINQATGAIKFGSSASVTAPLSLVSSRASAGVELNISEVFNIVGTGDITFRLAIEGLLSSTSLAGGTGSRYGATMRLVDQTGAFGFDVIGRDRTFANPPRGTTQIVNDVLEFTTTITSSQDYLFLLNLDATAATEARGFGNSGSSQADFLNTAFLSFEADDTLTVTASDPLFLSGVTGPVAPVPLPASAVLFASAFGLLRLTRRRSA
jgi:hypothetical protein